MLDVLQRDFLTPEARTYLALKCVMRPPKNAAEVFRAVYGLLFETEEKDAGTRITSFDQDAGLIRSAFRQAYGIDLFRERMHWLEFLELAQNLPEGTRYQEVLGIRAREIPPPTKYNQKEREWLIRAKESVAIRLTEEEQARKYERDVGKIFSGLMSMIPKGGQENGE